MQNITQIEDSLWAAADNLRANSKLTSSEYCMPVLGIIFLRHATNRYNAACKQIEAEQAAGKIPSGRAIVRADFHRRRALMLPKEARYDELLKLPTGTNLGTALVEAMNAIERDYEPLREQLPKDYDKFGDDLLEDLLRVFDSNVLRTASGDVFGRIYEYFLMKFAMQGAQDSGEFFTPPSLVQTIVNVIEPDHGTVFDPACGSGGMFVQTSHFIEQSGEDTSHRVQFYGQEKTATTIRLAKMNLAVHGLDGKIAEANTFYEDVHTLFNRCDFVMANPPFNVDLVDAEKVKNDCRLPFGLPGISNGKPKNKEGEKKKKPTVSNGNYLWISYFYSYLGPAGRAGFVMSSQASSAGHGEATVRRQLIETEAVDVMISIRSNFFYTRTVPCELWHLDKGKPADRRGKVLMIDARNIYRKVTRKIYDFSPEQLRNLTAIVWLYRGQDDRFAALVKEYLDRTLAEASVIAEKTAAFRSAYSALAAATGPFCRALPADSPLRDLLKERDGAAAACFQALDSWTIRIAGDWRAPCPPELPALQQRMVGLDGLATACRSLVQDVDMVGKLAERLVDAAEKNAGARSHDAWDNREISRLEKQLDAARLGFDEQTPDGITVHHPGLVEQLKQTAYFHRQAHWLLSRFPDGRFAPVPGLCRIVSIADINDADWSLTPGRFVGVAPPEVDEDFDFQQAMRDIHIELADLNREAAELATRIQENFRELGI